MQTIRQAVNAALNLERYKGKSVREHIAEGTVDFFVARERFKGLASSGTVRKWRRTHEAREAGWIK